MPQTTAVGRARRLCATLKREAQDLEIAGYEHLAQLAWASLQDHKRIVAVLHRDARDTIDSRQLRLSDSWHEARARARD